MTAVLITVLVLLVLLVLAMFRTQKRLEAEIKTLKSKLKHRDETEMYVRSTAPVVEVTDEKETEADEVAQETEEREAHEVPEVAEAAELSNETEETHFSESEEVMHLYNLGTEREEISRRLAVPMNKINLIIKFDKIKKEKPHHDSSGE